MSETLLEIRHLKTTFQTDDVPVEAVNDIGFTLNKGEAVGIVGESGSGKSVTALSIMRLVPKPGKIVSGEITFDSPRQGHVDLLRLSEKGIRHVRGKEIAMIFQEPMTSLNPVFRCGSQVSEAIRLHLKASRREACRQTLALFDKVLLPEPERIYRSYPHQLSGGQKQRVMIAMALSCNPSVLIADEPTTALDVTVQKAIIDLLMSLQKEYGLSVIFITHDLGVIAEIADRVAVMFEGRIVEQGTADDILRNPTHPYTKGLLACRPPLDVRYRRLPVISDFMIRKNGDLAESGLTISEAISKVMLGASEVRGRLGSLMKNPPLLGVEHLKAYYVSKRTFTGKVVKHVKAVDDVSFEVYPGETLGLVGESGCGKTTLGRSLIRLAEVHDGRVTFDNKNVLEQEGRDLKTLRKQMQIIFQDPYSSLNPRMIIGHAIKEPMHVHGLHGSDRERTDKVQQLLQKVGLMPEHYHRYPHEFSGGQRQRICIARALALEPRFIICDECVSALDVSVQAQVLNLLLSLREEFGLTYIFISHDLSVVRFMSDRMMVMNNGRIEEIGPADEVYRNPTSDYTRKLIAAIPGGQSRD